MTFSLTVDGGFDFFKDVMTPNEGFSNCDVLGFAFGPIGLHFMTDIF